MTGEILRDPDFTKYWIASTISSLGAAATTVAVPVLVVQELSASNFEVGLVNAAQLLPYLILGLVAGVFIDRWRRKAILIWSGIGRALLLTSVPALWILGWLTLPVLIAILIGLGSLVVFGVAATQAFLPTIVPRSQLLPANARVDQSDAVAQTVGPAAGGALVAALGAPLILMIEGATFVVNAVLIGRITVDEPKPEDERQLNFKTEIREGIDWTYRHPTLAPLSISTHVWFFGNSAAVTALAPFVLRDLDVSSFVFGMLFAVLGVATLLGALMATRVGGQLGTGRTVVICRVLYTLPWIAVSVAASDFVPPSAAVVTLFIAMALYGIAGGLENPNEVGFRQAVTPQDFLGRVNSTVRSANRTVAVGGALTGGAVAGAFGYRAAFAMCAAAFAGAFMIAVLTPLRNARIDNIEAA